MPPISCGAYTVTSQAGCLSSLSACQSSAPPACMHTCFGLPRSGFPLPRSVSGSYMGTAPGTSLSPLSPSLVSYLVMALKRLFLYHSIALLLRLSTSSCTTSTPFPYRFATPASIARIITVPTPFSAAATPGSLAISCTNTHSSPPPSLSPVSTASTPASSPARLAAGVGHAATVLRICPLPPRGCSPVGAAGCVSATSLACGVPGSASLPPFVACISLVPGRLAPVPWPPSPLLGRLSLSSSSSPPLPSLPLPPPVPSWWPLP